LARLEESESPESGRARGWLDRAILAPPDPCYVCAACRAALAEWHPLCPECGGFDTLAWRIPERAGRDPAGEAVLLPPMLPGPGSEKLDDGAAKPPDRLGADTTIG
jgi:HemY protein